MENYIVVNTKDNLLNLAGYLRTPGLLVYCIEDTLIYSLQPGLRDFKVMENKRRVTLDAKNFINLTITHGFNTQNINVISYNKTTGDKVNLDWKLGSTLSPPTTEADGNNNITITASYIINDLIHISLIEF